MALKRFRNGPYAGSIIRRIRTWKDRRSLPHGYVQVKITRGSSPHISSTWLDPMPEEQYLSMQPELDIPVVS